MFPARNRIVSGLSRAVVVVEANARSGALITVTHAAEQGREVYAVPGPVDSPASAGCLHLLRTGARLVRDADDILEDLAGLSGDAPPPVKVKPATLFDAPAPVPAPVAAAPAGPPPGLDGVLLRVWEGISGTVHADELARALGLPAGELGGVLMRLELKKAVRKLPGGHWERR